MKILLRADSGFAREALMAWCEANKVDYVFGLARNARLEVRLADALDEARLLSQANAGRPARVFRDFDWSTKETWSRRLAALRKTLLRARRGGEMENRIKECQGDMFADRTSAATMRANQLRLWRVRIAFASACPDAQEWRPAAARVAHARASPA